MRRHTNHRSLAQSVSRAAAVSLSRVRTCVAILLVLPVFAVRAGAQVGSTTDILTGVVTRQLANAPHEKFDEGRFSTALGDLVTMFARHYEAQSAKSAQPTPPDKGSRNARRR